VQDALTSDSHPSPRPHRSLGSLSLAAALLASCGLLAGCSLFGGSSSDSSTSAPKDQSPSDIPRVLVPGIAGEPDMRVRVAAASTKLRLSASVGGALYAAPTGSNRPAARLSTPVEVQLTATEWELKDSSGLVGRFPRTTSIELAASEGAVGGMARLNASRRDGQGDAESPVRVDPLREPSILLGGKPYSGTFRLVARGPAPVGTFDVIETTGIEEYLKGVVSSELFASWPQGAFNAQAVAARSYALHERTRARAAGAPFDVEASVNDQAYSGSSELPQAIAAVRQTRGVVLTWSGQILRAYYSSTSGGRAASAKDVWPTTGGFDFNLAGPLQAQSREELGRTAKYYRWTVYRTRYELLGRLRAWGETARHPVRSLKSIEAITVEARNNVGRPTRYRVIQPGGVSYTLNAEEIRRACNEPAPGLPTITGETMVRSGDMEFKLIGDVFSLSGRGYGHGVGLCQWSAKELADKGQDWRAIVSKFYPGARIEKAY
jgi:stage II sporulation protein D